ncbi:MAG: choice-of-anchor L domain-containing protein, partial [Saprospiraceae bacterium]|nr:choice-of-anchor L domain-containing protein [Saprospiraceae bacterium]
TNEFEGWKGYWECSSTPCPPQEQMTVNTGIQPVDIVNAVATPATVVTITGINCADGAYGTFSFPTDNNALGLDKGLILTSGDAQLSIGPNIAGFTGFNAGFEGDDDLDYLSQQQGNGQPSFDACVVELDVFVATNELSFEYVFGSDEYPEFVNSNFNDIFAFLVSGPGITGDPGLGGAQNIAVLPNSNTFVQINSVNNLVNWPYYRNNQGVQTLSDVIEYDGLTSDSFGIKKSLTARTSVIPCNTYHLKLAISDRGDGNYDSGVFVSKIQGGTPDLAVQFASGIKYFIEDCSGNQDQLVISLSQPVDEATSFIVNIGGTATLGTDYTLSIPDVITFQPGQTSLSFPIVPLADTLTEGVENIVITLSNDFGCGTVVYKVLTVEIADNVIVDVKGGDTLFVCAGATLQLEAEGATDYFWAPPGAVSNPFVPNPTITPTQDIWLEVTGTIASCVDVDSVYVTIVDPSIDVVALSDSNICLGNSVQLQAINNVNSTGLVWSPTTGLDDPSSPTPIASPTQTTTYTASVSIAGCTVSDQITIQVDTLFFPTFTTFDTTVCQNYPVQLADSISSTTVYQWSPTAGLSSDTISGPVALPDVTTTYTLVATSANGFCSQMESVNVNVIAADVDIEGDEYKEICLGDTLSLTALSSPAGAQVQWSPSFYVSSPSGPNVQAFPDESTTIIATYSINNCTVYDSIRIRVDSLPDQSIIRVEDKAIYCPGDTVYLISPTYEPANFPDIMIEWLPFSGQETPLDLWNLVITATSTHTFERIITNRGCKDTSSIEVPVATPPTLTVDATPMQICPGQSAEIMVTVDPPGTGLEWQDMPPTLSCTTCANPTATPNVTTTYTVTTPDADCPSGASVEIVVLPNPTLNLPVNPIICPGGSLQLNTVSEPGVTYMWSPATGLDNPISATPTAMPGASTTYSVTATGALCTSQGSVNVTVASATIDAGADQTVCFNEGTTLMATTTGTPGTVTWTPGNFIGPDYNVNPPTVGTITYTAMLSYGNNCSAIDSMRLTIVPGVELSNISATPDPTDSICIGVPITLKTAVIPASAVLAWTQDGVAIPGIEGDSVTFVPNALEGEVQFNVIATSDNGCTAEKGPVTYTFKRCLAVPNAFTPGGDGVNDTFGPLLFGSNTEIVQFMIFNRWGQKVFEATPGMQRWDGKKDGKDAPSDVYVYYIVLRYANGVEEKLKGDVTLLR